MQIAGVGTPAILKLAKIEIIEMALDITITVNGKAPKNSKEQSISFEGGDADYWHLYPLFEKLAKETGEMIDLYADSEFSNGSLLKLRQLLVNEIDRVKAQKEKQWSVYTGTQLQPEKKEIFKVLTRKDFIQKLEKWVSMIDIAIKTNEKIICIGD